MPSLKELRLQLPELEGLDDQTAVDAVHQAFYPDLDRNLVAERLGIKPPPAPVPKAGVMRTIGDMALKGAQGVVGLGESAVGLADLATGGAAGEGLANLGYDPKRAKDIIGEGLSDAQKASDQKVADAKGFLDTLIASIENPRSIAGSVAESMPSMMGTGAMMQAAARRIYLEAAAAAGGAATAAGQAAGRAAVEAAAGRLMTVGNVGEGAITAGQIAEQSRQENPNNPGEMYWAVPAGIGTAAIGRAAGKLMGDAETAVFTGAKGAGVKGSLPARVAKSMFSEGVLEEAPQSAQEQVFTNLATGKPADQGVGEAAASGLLAGAVMGGGMAVIQRENEQANEAIRKIGDAKTVDEAIQAANELASGPTSLMARARAMTEAREAAALTAIERQGQLDLQSLRQSGREDPTGLPLQPNQPTTGADGSAEVIDSPMADRILTVREQLADPQVRAALRAKLGDQAMREALYYVQAADMGSNLPEKTRERMLQVAEGLIDRATLTDITPKGVGSNQAPAAEALRAPVQSPLIGLDTGSTGNIRVDSAGNAAPETRADAISTAQRVNELREQRRTRGFEGQTPRDQMRGAGPGVMVGEGTLTPTPRPVPQPTTQVQSPETRLLPFDQGTAAIDAAAHEAATSPTNDRPEPTDAQKEAGNYKVGRVRISGMDVSIENPKGSIRRSKADAAQPWEVEMPAHYGYIRGTKGSDGDHVDLFIGDKGDNGRFWVINQTTPDGKKHDEHKVITGVDSAEEATALYKQSFTGGFGDKVFGSISAEMGADQLKAMLPELERPRPVPAAAPAPAPAMPTASWVIREKATGKVIAETFDRKKVDALNTEKYEAVPIQEHLASLNREQPASLKDRVEKTRKATAAPTPEPAKGAGGETGSVFEQDGKFFVRYGDDRAASGPFKTRKAAEDYAKVPTPANSAAPAPAPAAQEPAEPVRDKAFWLKAVANQNRLNGMMLTGLAPNGLLNFNGVPHLTKSGKALAATVEEARKAGATNAEIAEAATGKPATNSKPAASKQGTAVTPAPGQREAAPKTEKPLAQRVEESKQEPEGLVTIPASEEAFAAALDKMDPGAATQGDGDAERLHALFGEQPNKVTLPRAVGNKVPAGVEVLTPEQAAAKLKEWKAEAKRQSKEAAGRNGDRTVISLFDASGVLAQPWAEAGYNVVTYDLQTGADINEFDAQNLLEQHGNDNVFAILAQPPCTDFASSGAQWWKAKDADGRTEASNELVRQVLRTVELFRPSVWVMENPVGRIAKLNKMPDPTLKFDPWHFGDPYTKRTELYGRFNPELPTAMVEPSDGSKMHRMSSSAKYERSLTSEPFAYALFMANNAESMGPVGRLAAEFAGVERELFQRAVDAGKSEYDIRSAIQDSYYESDLEMVREELAKLAKDGRKPAPSAPAPASGNTLRANGREYRVGDDVNVTFPPDKRSPDGYSANGTITAINGDRVTFKPNGGKQIEIGPDRLGTNLTGLLDRKEGMAEPQPERTARSPEDQAKVELRRRLSVLNSVLECLKS